MPEHLIDVAGWWAEFNPAPANPSTGRKPNLNEEHPTPCVVPYTDDGYEIMARLGEMADREYKVAMKRRDYVRATIWTRAFETAGRLALVYACSKDYRLSQPADRPRCGGMGSPICRAPDPPNAVHGQVLRS